MSAYMVDKAHIDALVRLAERHQSSYYVREGYWVQVVGGNRNTVGQMLTDANVTSVMARYRGEKVENLPGRIDHWWTEPYRFGGDLRTAPLTPVQGLKAINGYVYQACEASTWETSEAHAFCEALRAALIRKLDGYEQAEWSISDPEPEQTPSIDADYEPAQRSTDAAARIADLADADPAMADIERFMEWRAANIPGGE